MGLHTSPNSFQMFMDKILRGLTFKSCLCYLDDVLICSETYEQHLSDLSEIFKRFRHAGLKLNPGKCSFAQSSCIFLEHHISKEGIRPPPDRVQALNEYPSPRNVKQLKRALGMFGWFRKYITNYSIIAERLTRLLKKNTSFVWSFEQETAFKELKSKLVNSEILAFPRFDLPFNLAVDRDRVHVISKTISRKRRVRTCYSLWFKVIKLLAKVLRTNKIRIVRCCH